MLRSGDNVPRLLHLFLKLLPDLVQRVQQLVSSCHPFRQDHNGDLDAALVLDGRPAWIDRTRSIAAKPVAISAKLIPRSDFSALMNLRRSMPAAE